MKFPIFTAVNNPFSMKLFKYLTVIFLSFSLLSCDEDLSKDFKLNLKNNDTKITFSKPLQASVKFLKDHEVTSIIYKLQGEIIFETQTNEALNVDISDFKLGNHELSVEISVEGETVTLSENIKILNDQKPKIFTYEILETYPHDILAYTQGLEFHGDTLYESTGQRGKSSLRKVDYKTGEMLEKVDLDQFYFGEGLSILNDKIYQLTWQSQEGIIYDLETMEALEKFNYGESKEGWGLCNDGKQFYKSDGTDKIWLLDQNTMEETGYLQATTNTSVLNQLNELEWIEGEIYANTYQKDGVVIINPKNGAVTGVVDFRGLRDKVKQHSRLDVLNGIAYHKASGKIFVTGKNWNKLFEVNIIPK
ncbi:MAG: glutaminyl-peptide cyclotransferase [Psychroflexus sp.]